MSAQNPPGFRFFCDCVGWQQDDVSEQGGLSDMIAGALTISRRTFLRHVDRDDLRDIERELSYDTHPKRGLTMAGDCHVSYHRSKHHGERVYFFTQSAIEFVFKSPRKNNC